MRKLLVITAVLVLASSLAAAAPPTAGELLRLVPDGAHAIVALDSAALRSHPFVQSWLARQHLWAATDEKLQSFLDDAGLDPVRDLDLIVLAALGDGEATTGVAFLVGRYDAGALAAALTARGATPVTLAGVAALRLPEAGRCGAATVLVQRSAELAIVGDEAAVAASLAPGRPLPALVATEIASGQLDLRAPFWMAAEVPAAVRRHTSEAAGRMQGDGSEAVRGALLASGTVRKVIVRAYLDDSVRVVGTAATDTPENAELLRDAVKGALAAARLHAQGSAPELVDVLRGVDVTSAGASVTGKGAIPVAVLERVLEAHKATRSGDEL